MAQTDNFWMIHGEAGRLYKQIILDKGLTSRRFKYPITALNDKPLLELYKGYIISLSKLKRKVAEGSNTTSDYCCHLQIVRQYSREVAKYHIASRGTL